MNTKLGWQLLEDPPESYLIHTYGSRGIKIVGNANSLKTLKYRPEPVKVGRCIELEQQVLDAQTRNKLSEIPALSEKVANEIKAIADQVGDATVFYEIPPIMPPVTPWIVAWEIEMLRKLRERKIRSVAFGFATGTPQVKPFASAQNSDEWPALYPVLEVMHEIGIGWTRLGVEEYIVKGVFNPADKSNICRLDYVYEFHIVPNGWNILAFVIEVGFDLPGMLLIKGMSPDRALGTVDTLGLAAVDAEYAKRPFIDTAFLYAVVDPTRSQEKDFAFTPGNRNGPGYLEKFEGYFSANVPAGPITELPPQQPPTDPPTPTMGINLLKNASFEGPTHFYPDDRFGDRKVPESWDIAWNSRQAAPHIEIDQHPPRVKDQHNSIRFWADARFQVWAYQIVDVEAGSTYEFEAYAVGTRDPGITGIPNAGIAIGPQADLNFLDLKIKTESRVYTEWTKFTLTYTALQNEQLALFVAGRTGNNGRGDVWIDAVSFSKIDSVPQPDPIPVDEFVLARIKENGTRVRALPTTESAILWQANAGELFYVYRSLTPEGWAKLMPRAAFPESYIRADLIDFI